MISLLFLPSTFGYSGSGTGPINGVVIGNLLVENFLVVISGNAVVKTPVGFTVRFVGVVKLVVDVSSVTVTSTVVSMIVVCSSVVISDVISIVVSSVL